MHELNAHADAGSLQWNVACAFRDAVNAKLLLHFGRFGVAGVTPMSHPPARFSCVRAGGAIAETFGPALLDVYVTPAYPIGPI